MVEVAMVETTEAIVEEQVAVADNTYQKETGTKSEAEDKGSCEIRIL